MGPQAAVAVVNTVLNGVNQSIAQQGLSVYRVNVDGGMIKITTTKPSAGVSVKAKN